MHRLAALVRSLLVSPFRHKYPNSDRNAAISACYANNRALVDDLMQAANRGPMMLQAAVMLAAFGRAIINRPHQRDMVFEAMRCIVNMNFDRPYALCLLAVVRWYDHKGRGAVAGRRAEAYGRMARALQAFLDGENLTRAVVPSTDPFPQDAQA